MKWPAFFLGNLRLGCWLWLNPETPWAEFVFVRSCILRVRTEVVPVATASARW